MDETSLQDGVNESVFALVDAELSVNFATPAIVAQTRGDAAERFLEFFAATIRNANTRGAYV